MYSSLRRLQPTTQRTRRIMSWTPCRIFIQMAAGIRYPLSPTPETQFPTAQLFLPFWTIRKRRIMGIPLKQRDRKTTRLRRLRIR